MSTDFRSTKHPVPLNFLQPSRAQKTAIATVAVLVSTTLLGGMLSMFEMRGEELSMTRASVATAPATDGLAVRRVGSGPRG